MSKISGERGSRYIWVVRLLNKNHDILQALHNGTQSPEEVVLPAVLYCTLCKYLKHPGLRLLSEIVAKVINNDEDAYCVHSFSVSSALPVLHPNSFT